jgi:hypothetical protein
MLHPVFDRFTTVTVAPTEPPSHRKLAFRLFDFYPLGTRLCVPNHEWLKDCTAEVYSRQPYWYGRSLVEVIGTANIHDLQRVAVLLRQKPNKTYTEVCALKDLETSIELAQTHASHPSTTTVPTV